MKARIQHASGVRMRLRSIKPTAVQIGWGGYLIRCACGYCGPVQSITATVAENPIDRCPRCMGKRYIKLLS